MSIHKQIKRLFNFIDRKREVAICHQYVDRLQIKNFFVKAGCQNQRRQPAKSGYRKMVGDEPGRADS